MGTSPRGRGGRLGRSLNDSSRSGKKINRLRYEACSRSLTTERSHPRRAALQISSIDAGERGESESTRSKWLIIKTVGRARGAGSVFRLPESRRLREVLVLDFVCYAIPSNEGGKKKKKEHLLRMEIRGRRTVIGELWVTAVGFCTQGNNLAIFKRTLPNASYTQ